MKINENSKKIADENGFEVKSYKFEALKEDLRKPRIVKIGAVQNSIVLSTSEPINTQRDAIFEKIGKLVDAASSENVNVLCLQEAWSKKTCLKAVKILIFLVFSNAVCILYQR